MHRKLNFNQNKIVLRKYAEKLLPKSIFKTPKRPFYLPLDSYVKKGPLKDIFSEMLDPKRLKQKED